jgi:glycosyltransferase involved in cell wall biosynthesis
MRVALLSVSAEMGGSEVSLFELVKGIRRQAPDWDLHLVVPREGPLAARTRGAGATVHVLPFPKRLAAQGEPSGAGTAAGFIGAMGSLTFAAVMAVGYRRRLRRLLTALEPDVVHTNGFKLHLLGTRAAPHGVPVIWHVHEYVSRRPVTRALLRWHSRHAAAIVTNSDSVSADVIATVGSRLRVTRIYNAVDSREFSPDGPTANLDVLSRLAPAAPGTVRIGLIATYGRWKGHDVFLEALRTLPRAVPFRGYIVGDALYDTAGSQYSRGELSAMIAAAGLTGRVALTGFVERPSTAMRALDIVVHASTQPEPFGLVIAEAKACGRAVIASVGGGASELVTDGVDALTHRPGDIDGLAAAMRSLATDAALRARLGHAAEAAARQQFDPDAFAVDFMKIYRDACGSGAS